jgi:hypothetical protein
MTSAEQSGEGLKNIEGASHEPATSPDETKVRRFGIHLFLILVGGVVGMIIAATSTYWFRSYQPGIYGGTTEYYLYQVVTQDPGASVIQITDLCDGAAQRIQASYVFSIISSIVIGVSFAFGVVALIVGPGKFRTTAWILAAVVILTTLISWTLAIRVYLQPYCTYLSLKDQGYDLGPGPFLSFLSTVFLIPAVLVAIFDPPLPRTKDEVRFVASTFFMLSGFISTLFCSLGSGITIWKYRDLNNDVTEVSIWKTITPNSNNSNFDINCYDLDKLFKAAAAFAVTSSGLSLACWIIGFVRMFRKISILVPLILGGLTSLTTLITWAILTNIWYRQFCPSMPSYEQSFFIRTPGYGFFVAAFCEIFFSTLVVVYGCIKNRQPETTFPARDVILMVTTFLSALFGTVCMPLRFFTLLSDSSFTDSYQRIYLWFVDVRDASNNFTHYSNLQEFFNCESETLTIKAVRYLQLSGVVFATVGTIASFVMFKLPKWRYLVLVFNYCAFVLYTSAMVLWIVVYDAAICNSTSVSNQGFGIDVGAAIQMLGWMATIYGVVYPCLPFLWKMKM